MNEQRLIAIAISCAPLAVLAQSGTYDLKPCSVSESTVINRAGDMTILAVHVRGISDSNPAGGPFDKNTYECRQLVGAAKAAVEFTGRCTFVDKDGHKALGSYSGSPAVGAACAHATGTYTLKK